MIQTRRHLGSLLFVAAGILFIAGSSATQVACSSKTCSSSEDQACTNTYTTCITTAAAAASLAQCQKCVDDYCNCYNACGNTCDSAKLKGQCTGT